MAVAPGPGSSAAVAANCAQRATERPATPGRKREGTADDLGDFHPVASAVARPREKVPGRAKKRMHFAPRVALLARVVAVASFKAPLLHSLLPRSSSSAPALVRMASDKSFRNPHNLPTKVCEVCNRCRCLPPPRLHSTAPPHSAAAARPHGHSATTVTRSLALLLRLSHDLSSIGRSRGGRNGRTAGTRFVKSGSNVAYATLCAPVCSPACSILPPSMCDRSSAARSDASQRGKAIATRARPRGTGRGARLPWAPMRSRRCREAGGRRRKRA